MRMRPSGPIIDAHVGLGYEHHLEMSVDALMTQMDAHEVALSIARPMGGELTVHYIRGNKLCAASSPRILGLATANPWADDAIDVLRQSGNYGAYGLYLHPTRQGF